MWAFVKKYLERYILIYWIWNFWNRGDEFILFIIFFFTDDEFNSSINTGDSYLEWNLRALIPECKYHHLSFEIYMKIVNFICVLILQDVTPFINGV